VGEVRQGTIRLEEAVIPSAMAAGLDPIFVLINDQAFTKTANLWGVSNNRVGTNTNRVVLLRKPSQSPLRRRGGRGAGVRCAKLAPIPLF
jgi:hypothetical protein